MLSPSLLSLFLSASLPGTSLPAAAPQEPKPSVAWQRTIEDALAVAKATGNQIARLAHVNALQGAGNAATAKDAGHDLNNDW